MNSFTDWDRYILCHSDGGYVSSKIKNIIAKKMPEYKVHQIVTLDGGYFVDLRPSGSDSDLMEWHYVDLHTGHLSGNIPTGILMDSQYFKKALEESEGSYLQHYGVKGQKWGERRWQNPDGSLTPAGREHYGVGNGRDKTVYGGRVAYELKQAPIAVLSKIPGLNMVVLGMAVVGGINSAKQKHDKKTMSEDQANEQFRKIADIDHKFSSEKDVAKIEAPHSADEDMKAINPLRKTFMSSTGSTNNCMFCTTAYDLRRRGYDVVAKAGFGRSSNNIAKWYENAKVERADSKTWSDFGKKLMQYPDGARGNLMVKSMTRTGTGGGHSMIWEKENGQIVVRDAQVNKKHKINDFHMVSTWDIKTATYVRTDNCEINWEAVNECAANKKH